MLQLGGYERGVPSRSTPPWQIYRFSSPERGEDLRIDEISQRIFSEMMQLSSRREIEVFKKACQKGPGRDDGIARAEIAFLREAFPENQVYFERIADLSLENHVDRLHRVLEKAQVLTEEIEEQFSPIQIPLAEHTRRVSPHYYRLVAGAIERLWQRDCELISFFESYFSAHQLSSPEPPRGEMGVPEKAEWIRKQILENSYSLTTLLAANRNQGHGMGGYFFRSFPPELIHFQMSDAILDELFLYDEKEFLFASHEPWFFESYFALLEAGKFEMFLEESPRILETVSEEWRSLHLESIQDRRGLLLLAAVSMDRNASAKILLRKIGRKLNGYFLQRLAARATKRKNWELVELIEEQYRKNISFGDRCFCSLMHCICLSCACFCKIICCGEKKREGIREDWASWKKYHTFRDLSSPSRAFSGDGVSKVEQLRGFFPEDLEYLDRLAAPVKLFSTLLEEIPSDEVNSCFARALEKARSLVPQQEAEVLEMQELFSRAIGQLKEADRNLIQFFTYYVKKHQLILPCMQEEKESVKAEKIREEIKKQNFRLRKEDLVCFPSRSNRRSYPPEIAYFRMSSYVFRSLLHFVETWKTNEEIFFLLIESGKVEFFPHDDFSKGLLETIFFSAVARGRIRTMQILFRVLTKNSLGPI